MRRKGDGPVENRKPVDDEYIPSLEKGLSVIRLFSSEKPEWTLSQIASELQLTPGSTRRILRTLEILGYAVSSAGRYRLTAQVLALGFAYLSSQPFSEAARPLLRELATKLNITCTIAVLDNRDVVYVARATSELFRHYHVHVGSRFPAYATSPGKVLLAALPKAELAERLKGWKLEAFTPNTVSSIAELKKQLATVQEQGYSLNDQEIFMGQRSIAVPLKIGGSQTAAIVAATNVGMMTLDGMVEHFLPELRAAAHEIEEVAAVLL